MRSCYLFTQKKNFVKAEKIIDDYWLIRKWNFLVFHLLYSLLICLIGKSYITWHQHFKKKFYLNISHKKSFKAFDMWRAWASPNLRFCFSSVLKNWIISDRIFSISQCHLSSLGCCSLYVFCREFGIGNIANFAYWSRNFSELCMPSADTRGNGNRVRLNMISILLVYISNSMSLQVDYFPLSPSFFSADMFTEISTSITLSFGCLGEQTISIWLKSAREAREFPCLIPDSTSHSRPQFTISFRLNFQLFCPRPSTLQMECALIDLFECGNKTNSLFSGMWSRWDLFITQITLIRA